ncbi:hypothetical protein ANN_13108 [Periplaneta americana]|uniref:DUF4817 domain-containing protein n=1 Tax=Periplaneta americana TaxID=6978 RepID=A0ABQ8TIX2_PERAM|nr:hypothetical protein ANN_13108 [Periplaneta americana]
MSPGSNTEGYPAFAHTGLRENPGKNLNQVTCPDRESNPGHLVSRPDSLAVTPQETVEAYFKNSDSSIATQCIFRRHFNLGRHGRVPDASTIAKWTSSFRNIASACNHKPGRSERTLYLHQREVLPYSLELALISYQQSTAEILFRRLSSESGLLFYRSRVLDYTDL